MNSWQHWLHDLMWLIAYYCPPDFRFWYWLIKRKVRNKYRKIVWYLRGEPTLEADIRRIMKDFKKMEKECK